MTEDERFFAKVEVAENGCWLWTGQLSNGYGKFRAGGRLQRAHRWAYQRWIGLLLLDVEVDHQCHNADESCLGGVGCRHRRCVNPAHLDRATRRENLHRSKNTPNSIHSAQTHCIHGHEFTPENTKVDIGSDGIARRRCRECLRRRSRERRGRGATVRAEPVVASPAN